MKNHEGYCFDCGSPVPSRENQCLDCGSLEVGGSTAQVTRWPSVQGASLPWPWSALSWRAPALLLLSGAPGSGKSSLAAQLRPCLYMTTEQTPAEASSCIKRVQGDAYDAPLVVSIDDVEALEEVIGEQALKRGSVVVLDSVTELGNLEQAVEGVRLLKQWAYADGIRVVIIAQHTKDGKAAGRLRLPHLVDAVAQCEADTEGLRRLTITKNRHGDLFSTYFRLGAKGVGRPEFRAGYSVEGNPGNYRLVPFPAKGAKWADPFKGKTGIEGTACAARKCDSYSSGWLWPEDVQQRRDFAEAHGLLWVG